MKTAVIGGFRICVRFQFVNLYLTYNPKQTMLLEPVKLDTPDLFETPISSRKVRQGVTAYKYRNGIINIRGEKFQFYSMTESIKIWRSKNKL